MKIEKLAKLYVINLLLFIIILFSLIPFYGTHNPLPEWFNIYGFITVLFPFTLFGLYGIYKLIKYF